MPTQTISISCSECSLVGSVACEDCLVSFVVDGVRPPSGARSSSGARCAAHLSPPRRAQGAQATDRRATCGDACAVVHRTGVLLQEDEARAIETLAGAGLVSVLRFVPRQIE